MNRQIRVTIVTDSTAEEKKMPRMIAAPLPARLSASVPRTADWGVSVFEFEPLSAREAPRIGGLAAGNNPATLWSPGPARALAPTHGANGAQELLIELPRALPTAGLEVFWGAARNGAKLEARDASGKWLSLADDPGPLGDTSYSGLSPSGSTYWTRYSASRRKVVHTRSANATVGWPGMLV